jgi:hypothetical protein
MVEENSSGQEKKRDKSPDPIHSQTPSPATEMVAPQTVAPPDKSCDALDAFKVKKKPKQSEPLLIRVIEDEELKPFERNMYLLTVIGIVVASATAFFIWAQFRVMSDQTQVLSTQTQLSVSESIHSDQILAKQIALAQEQTKAVEMQAHAAQDSAIAVQRQMRQDQRPWIQLSLIPGDKITYTENSPLTAHLRITNTGKTAARHVAMFILLEYVKNGSEPTLPKLTDKKVRQYNVMVAGILFPNTPQDIQISGVSTKISTLKEKRSEPPPLTRSEHDDLASGKAYIGIDGFVRYDDVFNVKHWTTFCNWIAAKNGNYSASECARYNNVDNN